MTCLLRLRPLGGPHQKFFDSLFWLNIPKVYIKWQQRVQVDFLKLLCIHSWHALLSTVLFFLSPPFCPPQPPCSCPYCDPYSALFPVISLLFFSSWLQPSSLEPFCPLTPVLCLVSSTSCPLSCSIPPVLFICPLSLFISLLSLRPFLKSMFSSFCLHPPVVLPHVLSFLSVSLCFPPSCPHHPVFSFLYFFSCPQLPVLSLIFSPSRLLPLIYSVLSSPSCPLSLIFHLLCSPMCPLPCVLTPLSSPSYPYPYCVSFQSSTSCTLQPILSILPSSLLYFLFLPSSNSYPLHHPLPPALIPTVCTLCSVLSLLSSFCIVFLPVLFVMSPYSWTLSFLPFVISIMSSPCSPLPPLPK